MILERGSHIVIFGGKSFVGRYLLRRLAKSHVRIRIVDHNDSYDKLSTLCCTVGQVSFHKIPASTLEWESLLHNATHVINLIDISRENGYNPFCKAHVQLVEKIAMHSILHKVRRLIHISSLCTGRAKYTNIKVAAEQALLKLFPQAIIIRPSLIFGYEDHLTNAAFHLISLLPIVPVVLSKKAKFQPVYVDDLTKLIEICCDMNKESFQGRILEIGSQEQCNLKEIFKAITLHLNKKRMFLRIPLFLSYLVDCILSFASTFPLAFTQLSTFKKGGVIQGINAIEYLDTRPKTLLEFIKRRF